MMDKLLFLAQLPDRFGAAKKHFTTQTLTPGRIAVFSIIGAVFVAFIIYAVIYYKKHHK